MLKYIVFFLAVPFWVVSQSVYYSVEELIAQKNYAKAESVIFETVTKAPNDARAIELLGDAYAYQEKWDDAIVQYKQLVSEYQDEANYHYKYGGALAMKAQHGSKLRALGLIGDMKRAFLQASELDSNHIDTRWALVDFYITVPGIVGGSISKATKYAEELAQLSEVDGHLAKGYVYEYDNKPQLAEYHYKQAVKVGGSVTCFEKLSNFYEAHNQPEKAIITIEKGQEKHNRNALHYQLGKVSADYNVRLDKGERCLLTYIDNYSPADGVPKEWAYYRLAQIYKHKNDKANALEYINKALNLRSDFKQALKEKNTILKL